MTTTLLHADVDAFYASVAQRDDPALRDRPVAVGSWVVMAASYEARAFGVRSGMPASRARRLCPDLLFAGTSFDAYVGASRAVFDVFERFCPVVERGSMEEAFLDVTGCGRPGRVIAEELRRAVRDEVGLPLSVGVARTKVLAKIASRSAKPDGLYVVEPDRELEFLSPLPVERVWGIGPATAAKLHAYGLMTVGELTALDEAELARILGPAAGRHAHAIAHNLELRPVQRRRGRRSFGAQRALGRSRRSPDQLGTALDDLAERLAGRMARKGRRGRTVVLRMRFDDYERATRSTTLSCSTGDASAIAAAARELLAGARELVDQRGLTLVGLTVTNLDPVDARDQLSLPL